MSKRKQDEISEELRAESPRSSELLCNRDGAVAKRQVIEISADEPDLCSICFDHCCHTSTVNRLAGCKHVFCHLCIYMWMNRFRGRGTLPTCPLCRSPITSCRTVATRSMYVKRLISKLRTMGIMFHCFTNPHASRSDCIVYEVDATRAEQERLAKEGIPLTFTAMQLPPSSDTSHGASSSTAIEID